MIQFKTPKIESHKQRKKERMKVTKLQYHWLEVSEFSWGRIDPSCHSCHSCPFCHCPPSCHSCHPCHSWDLRSKRKKCFSIYLFLCFFMIFFYDFDLWIGKLVFGFYENFMIFLWFFYGSFYDFFMIFFCPHRPPKNNWKNHIFFIKNHKIFIKKS